MRRASKRWRVQLRGLNASGVIAEIAGAVTTYVVT
jgi:hypothetical protein